MKNRTLFNVPLNIIAVGLSTMLVAISSAAWFSISPFYLKDVLKVSIKHIGLIEQCSEASSQFFRLCSGIISDYLKRNKPMFLLGTIFSALARPFFILANGVFMVIVSKVLDRMGNGISATPRDAYVTQHSPANKKGSYLGLTMTFKTLGCFIGPFLVALIWYISPSFNIRTLLIIIAIPSFLAVFVCYFYMKEGKESKEKKSETQDLSVSEPLVTQEKEVTRSDKNAFKLSDIKYLSKFYWLFLGTMTFFYLARTPECYMLLSLERTGLPKWFCTGTIGLFNVTSFLVSYPAGFFSDKIGRTKVLILSFLTLSFSLFCFSQNVCWMGALGVVFWGIQRSTSQILSVVCIADVVPKKILGTAIGMLNLLTGIAGVASAYINGKIEELYNFNYAYYFSTATSIVALVCLVIFSKNYNKKMKEVAH